jgi:hypothetical protein
MIRSLCILLLAAGLAMPAFGQPAQEQAKIAYLINAVAELHGARFIRSGVEYDSARAADHLRLKLRRSGSRIATAMDFIVYCATGSTMNGDRYRIRFSDGRIVDSADFLRDKLAAYDARPPPRG